MIFSKELFFAVAFLIHMNAAINLNFFNFNRAPAQNETKNVIPIQPTKTISMSIKITELPTAVVNYSVPDSNINLIDHQKHEFENETEAVDASPEITDNNTSSAPSHPDLQEIDETRNCSVNKYSVNETVIEDFPNETTTKSQSTTPNLPGVPKKIISNSFILPKRKTVQFTHTIMTTFTKLETVYPSCLKLENVKSVCDGSLITIQPTPTLFSNPDLNTKMGNINDEDNFDIIEPPESRKKRAQDSAITSKNLKELESSFRVDFLEPSESDYEFEEFGPGDEIKNKNGSEKLQGRGSGSATQALSILESLLMHEPKFEFVTEYLATTSVRTITSNAATTTVIARNCIPQNINLEKCPTSAKFETKAPILPITPVVYKPENIKSRTKEQNVVKTEEKIISIKPKPTTNKPPVQKPQKPYDTMEQLREYLIMNAHRLITDKPNTFETVDLNAGATIIQSSDTALSPLYHKKRSNRLKRQR